MSIKIDDYLKRIKLHSELATSDIDIEKAKEGYQKYLDDQSAKAAEKQTNRYFEQQVKRNDNSEKNLIDAFKNIFGISPKNPDQERMTAIKNKNPESPNDNWTEEQKNIFGYKYLSNPEEAYRYAIKTNNAINQAIKEKDLEKIKESSTSNVGSMIGQSAASVLLAPIHITDYVAMLAEDAKYGDIITKPYASISEYSSKVQESVGTKLNQDGGTINENVPIFGGKGWGDVYGLGTSIAQSALAAATGSKAVTLATFFGMSATQGVNDALSRGASSDQALVYGTAAGLAEAIPEMISVKSLMGISKAEGVQNVFKAVLKQAGEEAKDEFTTSVLTEVADRWIMGGKSQFALTVQELMASGLSQEEAENKALTMTLENIAFDVISGAASGGISGAGAAGVNNINQRYFQGEKNARAKTELTPKQNELIAKGKKYEQTAKRSASLERKLAKGKELSGYDLRMLASEVANTQRASDIEVLRKAIIDRMKSEGVSDSQAKRLGEIALKKALGNEKLSVLEEGMLKRNSTALKVYNQMDADNMASGLSDSDWVEDTPLQKLRNESAEINDEGLAISRETTNMTGESQAIKPSLKARNAQEYKINPESLEGKFAEPEGKITYEKTSEDSRIHTEGISTSHTKEEIGEISALEDLANTLGVDIHMYESKLQKDGSRSYTDKDGNVITSSGYYDPNNRSIHIDLRAGDNGEGTMRYTASHELVHFMKDISAEHFDNLEKLVTEALIQGGSSIEKLIDNQRQKALANGQNLTEAQLREEMVAEACESFLASNTAVDRIKALKTENRSFWNALKRFFTSLFNKINSIYKTVDPDSYEGKYIANMRNGAKRIRDAFMEGVAAAGEKYSSERKALGEGANVKVNSEGEFVQGTTKDKKTIMTNARTWKNGGRSTLKATLASEGFSADDVKAALTIMDEHMRLVEEFGAKYTAQDIANNAVLTTDVKTGEAVLSAIISNGDYPVNIDLLTICKKREAYQQVINRLCESGMINKATIDSLAIAEINKILGKYGFETACLGCYVESRRIRIQEWAETIVKEWNGIVDKLEGKGKGQYLNASSDTFVADLSNEEISKLSSELESAYEREGLKYGRATVVKKMEQLQREVPSMRKYLTVSDLITPEGRANIKAWSQELNSLINCRYGTNTPKIIQKFNPYNSELARYGIVPRAYNSLRDYLYAIGGARMQSFSDFIIENWFDYAQIVADLAARKLPMHTYTKEASLVKLFGMTGIKINMSLIPDVDSSLGKEYAGLTKNKNGEYELIFADKDRHKATGGKSYMQSFNFADAIALQNDPNYSANIGTIAIGISDKQIEMMLDDSRIRMVIPYHSSGMNPIFAHLVGIKNYNDYTNDQSTGVKRIVDSNGNERSVKLTKEQQAKLTRGFEYNEALQRLGDARKAAEEYKDWCRDTSKHSIEIDGKTYYAELTPKFEKFSAHENYYKLLTDYNAYDCITEESKPQQDVTQTYPENFADMLGDELKSRDIYAKKQDAKWDDAMAEINAYLESHTRADTVAYADEHGIKISAKDRKLAKQESAKKDIRHKIRYPSFTQTDITNNIEAIADMTAVAKIDSAKLKKTGKRPIDIFNEYFQSLGNNIYTDVFGDIALPKASAKSEIRHGITSEKIAAIEAIPEVIKNGRVIFQKEKEAGVERIVICAPIEIGTTEYYMGVMLQRDSRYQRLYLHNVLSIEIAKEAISSSKENLLTTGALEDENHLSMTSILRKAIAVKISKQKSFENSSEKSEIRSKTRTTDNLGNELTEAQISYFKDSKIRDSKGNLKVLYHGTTADFNTFKKGDVGFHFGTKGAARGRVGYGKNVTIKEVYLNITNPIVFDDDLGSWDADYRLTQELYEKGILTREDAESVLFTDDRQYRRTTEKANKKLAEVLLSKGYDGIEYTNTHESKKDSTSYIIFDSKQAKLITNANPTESTDIRYKARSTVTSGQYAQMKANLSHGKVYSKASAMALVSKLAPGIRNRSFEDLSNKLWEGLNTYTSLEDKAAFASDMSEMFIDRMMVDTLTPNPEWDEASEKLSYLKPAITSINFTDAERTEIRHILDKDGLSRILGRWGYKSSGADTKRRYDLDVFITDISREMPGMEHLADMHPVDALMEIDKLYSDLSEIIKQKYESAYKDFSDEEINEIKRSIATDIMKAYQELGEQTKISKYLEEKLEYYQSRVDYWKAENAKTKAIARWNGILSTKALHIRELKKGAFYNATQYHQDLFKDSIEQLAKIQWRGNISPVSIRKVFADLKSWYSKENPMLYKDGESDNLYSDTIAAYIEKIGDTEKGAFDENTYAMVYDVMNHLYTMMRNYNKVFRAGRWEDAPTLVDSYLKIMEETKHKRNAVARLKEGYVTEFLEPMAIARRADGYDPNGFFTQTMEDLRRASINASVGEMNLRKDYDAFIDANKKYLANATKETVSYRGYNIPKLHLIGLYMTMKRKHARAGLALNGFEYSVKNKWWDSEDYEKIPGYVPLGDNVTQKMIDDATEEQMAVIEKSLSNTDKEYIRILEKLFNEDLKALKIERDMERQGYTNATLDYYYPIIRGAIAENVDTAKISDQNRATNASFNKNTVKGAKQRLVIISADSMVNRHITDMCKYYYMSQAIENYNVLYNCDTSGNANNPINIASFVKTSKIWEKDVAYFKKIVADMQGIVDPQTAFERFIEGARGSYAKFALGANLKVLFTQFSSMIAAGDIIGYKNILSLKSLKISTSDVDKYCPLASVRNYDKTILKAMSLTDKFGKISEAFTLGISKVDRFVIARLFASCQLEAQKKGLGELGTEENKIAAGKLLEKVIIETQQNSFATERSQAMRSRNELLKAITMFTADGMKIVSRMYDAFGELSVAKQSKDKAKTKAAQKKVARSVAVAASIAVYMSGIAVLFNWIYDRDDEEDENALLSFTLDTVGNFLGALPFISDFYDYCVNGFEVESVAFDTLNNIFGSINNISKDLVSIVSGDGERSIQDINRDLRTMLYGVGQATGFPFRNMYNLARGIIGNFSSSAGYKLDSKFYETSLAGDLEKAIENGDNSKISYMMALIYDERVNKSVSESQIDEIVRLLKSEYESNPNDYNLSQKVLPKDLPDEIKRDGVEYVLTAEQKDVFSEVYSGVTDKIDNLISSTFYLSGDDERKSYLIDYYHDKYYDMAVNEALNLEDTKKTVYDLVGFEKYAEFAYSIKDIESDKDKNGNTVSGSKKKKVIEKINSLGISSEKKLLLIAYSGYKLDSEADKAKLLRYLNRSTMTVEEKKALAKKLKLQYKNGKFY